MRHGWLRIFAPFRELETNPQVQLKVHIWGRRFWIANVPIVFYLYIFHQRIWIAAGVLAVTAYSLYANWADDDAAVAALTAQLNTTPSTAILEQEIKNISPNHYDI